MAKKNRSTEEISADPADPGNTYDAPVLTPEEAGIHEDARRTENVGLAEPVGRTTETAEPAPQLNAKRRHEERKPAPTAAPDPSPAPVAEEPEEAPRPTSADAEVPGDAPRPLRSRMEDAISKGVLDKDGVPTLVRFEMRNGRPGAVLVEADASAVQAAWELWASEKGLVDTEGFMIELLDIMCAWPARIMRPCMPLNLR